MATAPEASPVPEPSPVTVRILSNIRIRPVDPKTFRTTAYDANLERLVWAVRHREELFPEPTQPVAEEVAVVSEPPVLPEKPPDGSVPIDWGKVADEIVATPNPRDWWHNYKSWPRNFCSWPPNYPRNRRFRRPLKTSDGRRIHVNVP